MPPKRVTFRQILWLGALALCLLMTRPAPATLAQASWPPFWFNLAPSLDNNRITYRVELYSQTDQQLFDLAIKIPIPAGTRFVEAGHLPESSAEFNGQEVAFFMPVLDKYTEENWFTVEIIDPAQTLFTTQPWLTWKGAVAGNYLAEPVSLDAARQPLNWDAPGRSRLQLGVGASVANGVVTYTLYPKAIARERMLDLSLQIPLPAGVTVLSANAPLPFQAGVDDQQISFFALELPRQTDIEPLTFAVALTDTAASEVTLPIQARWKNGQADPLPGETAEIGRRYEGPDVQLPTAPPEELNIINTTIWQPQLPKQIIFDATGEVPFENYDLTSIAFQPTPPYLTAIFNTVGQLGPPGQPLEYFLMIDADCNPATGLNRNNVGGDYLAVYTHLEGEAGLLAWNTSENRWRWTGPISSLVDNNRIMVSLPASLFQDTPRFCWTVWAEEQSQAYNPDPPMDWLPDEPFPALTTYEIDTGAATTGSFNAAGIAGKLAVPFQGDYGLYDVHLFSLPTGREIDLIPFARQPNFHPTGRRLLVNHNVGGAENVFERQTQDGRSVVLVLKNYAAAEAIFEYDLAAQTEQQVSAETPALHPFYNPQGARLVYSSAEPTGSPAANAPAGQLFIQCGLRPPAQETDPRCQNLADLALMSAGQPPVEIEGSYPVWTANGLIAYQGCQTRNDAPACGIYLVSAAAPSSRPLQLTRHATDTPADTKGNLLAFTSSRDGNWEAYVMKVDGTEVTNISNSPASNDGLPAISPDGQWVAFVSDRDGEWGVWVAPVTRGPAHKLFPLPVDTPWGSAEGQGWLNERLSWGP